MVGFPLFFKSKNPLDRQSGAFHGLVAREVHDDGFRNYCNLSLDGYDIRVFLDGVEQIEYTAANPEEGWVRVVGHSLSVRNTLKGLVEIKIQRKPRHTRP